VLEPMLSSAAEITAPPAACSALAVRGARSATGEPVIARNFDYLPITQPFFTLREARPQHRFRSIDFTMAPLGGALDGMNEHGLCVTYDYAFPSDRPPSPAPSISMIISEALERCATVAEAVQWISARPRWGGALLMLADPGGDIASLELTNTRARVRRPGPDSDLLFHSNAFWLAEMREVEVRREAIFTERAPASMRGRRLHESAESRDARLAELVSGSAAFGADDLQQVMGDHGPAGTPDSQTPCVHGSYWFTTASMQYFPKSRRLRVAYSTACEARYETFEV
jgi:predicted choloylglycine hydrolase